jgi:polysaccharide export outer membrane protein
MSFMLSRFLCVPAVFMLFLAGGTFISVAGAQQPSRTSTVEGHLEAAPANYVLGSDDLLTLSVPDLEEISNKPVRIDIRGDITLPVLGRVHAAGLTTEQLAFDIVARLKRVLRDPEVVVSVVEFRSQPVSVLGSVNTPGVHQLEGHKTLYEVLSGAGGLRPDAGNTVTVTRSLKWGPIPLANAQDDSTGQYSVASVSSRSIMLGENPADNIAIRPDDVITVSKADLVYVIGSVKKPGGFVLGQNETISALQVLALAEGLNATAASDRAKIMRVVPGSPTRQEIPINLKKLLAGRSDDLPLQHDDILFVPNSTSKSLLIRGTETAISIGSGIAIYSHP